MPWQLVTNGAGELTKASMYKTLKISFLFLATLTRTHDSRTTSSIIPLPSKHQPKHPQDYSLFSSTEPEAAYLPTVPYLFYLPFQLPAHSASRCASHLSPSSPRSPPSLRPITWRFSMAATTTASAARRGSGIRATAFTRSTPPTAAASPMFRV